MSCIDAAVLSDYWLAALPPFEEQQIEEHLIGCEACGERLRETIALADSIRKLGRSGALRVIVSDSFLERVAQQDLRVRQYAPPVGGRVDCTVTVHDDLLIGRLAADLSGAKRVDMCLCDASGAEQLRLRDIPFNSAGREVIFNYPIEEARAMPANVLRIKLMVIDGQGERLLGEYTFDHTPS